MKAPSSLSLLGCSRIRRTCKLVMFAILEKFTEEYRIRKVLHGTETTEYQLTTL